MTSATRTSIGIDPFSDNGRLQVKPLLLVRIFLIHRGVVVAHSTTRFVLRNRRSLSTLVARLIAHAVTWQLCASRSSPCLLRGS